MLFRSNADDGRHGLTGHGSRPRDLQRRQLRRLRVLAGNRAPRRFVTRPRLQFPRSAAVPYPPPRNAGRSDSYANTACGSKLAGSTPSSPRRRQRPRDRSKQPRSSCCRPSESRQMVQRSESCDHAVAWAKRTSSLAVAIPKMQKERPDEWRHPRLEIGGIANNVNVGKLR